MTAHLIRYGDKNELAAALLKAGVSAESLPYFENRRETVQIYLTGVPAPAANIIKQEMLSRGGDAAVHAQTIRCGVEKSDVVIFGTRKQLSFLAEKLAKMPWWGLEKCAKEIISLTTAAVIKKIALPSGAALEFGRRTHLMGIINLTDDSFFEGSRSDGAADAARRAVKMAAEGADILDLGAESTRPGAGRVPEETEISRMTEAVRAIRRELPRMPLSIDTTRGSVAYSALEAGADIINDVSGLTYDKEVARAAARYKAMLVVMHMRGTPETMGDMCCYDNLISEVCCGLRESAQTALELGVSNEYLITDPGLGFAKTHEQNLELVRHCESFRALGWPVLIGASRKGFVGRATGAEKAGERLAGTLAVTALTCWQRADIIRVHDVKENKEVIKMTEAIRGADNV